uniref:Uncharacterized protein n=1 Tax=Globodera rostochiensis TaxID=31243 RepID=A0A914H4T9_GLORO
MLLALPISRVIRDWEQCARKVAIFAASRHEPSELVVGPDKSERKMGRIVKGQQNAAALDVLRATAVLASLLLNGDESAQQTAALGWEGAQAT